VPASLSNTLSSPIVTDRTALKPKRSKAGREAVSPILQFTDSTVAKIRINSPSANIAVPPQLPNVKVVRSDIASPMPRVSEWKLPVSNTDSPLLYSIVAPIGLMTAGNRALHTEPRL